MPRGSSSSAAGSSTASWIGSVPSSAPAARTPGRRWTEQRIIDTPHYRLVEESLRYVAWRNNTFGIHVHVGVQGHDRAIELMNRVRSILPDLLALSASSPWTDGRRTHLHSTRSQHFTRMFPRCGIPEPFAGWSDYDAFCRFLLDTGSIREHTQIWWCVRPHQSFGTIELRNADGAPDVREAIAISAFGYLMAARALRGIDEGEPAELMPGRRARGEPVARDPPRALARADRSRRATRGAGGRAHPLLLADAAPEARALGLERFLLPLERMLDEGNCAQRAIRRLRRGRNARGGVRRAGARDTRVGRVGRRGAGGDPWLKQSRTRPSWRSSHVACRRSCAA